MPVQVNILYLRGENVTVQLKPRKLVNIFWTGGWDSTFRLLQLAEMDLDIQPWYFIHRDRMSLQYEKKAMKEILGMIRSPGKFKARILKIRTISVDEMEKIPDEEISASFQALRDRYGIGIQYLWFALFCRHDGEGTFPEIGVEDSSRSRALAAMKGEGKLKDLQSGIPGQMILDWNNSSRDLCNIFGSCIFGMTAVSKKEAEIISVRKGWMEIMNLTWFCLCPVCGTPCGVCDPCKDAVMEGMAWRLPPVSRFRYRFMQNRLGYKIIREQRKFFGT